MSGTVSPDELRRLAAQCGGRTGRQSELAAIVGWDRSHITRLKQLGQLSHTADGQVDFAASLLRIADHADPARDAQRQIAAQRRAAGGGADSADRAMASDRPSAAADADAEDADDGSSPKYSASRATKEYWAAQTARVEYERLVGDLVRKADVDKAVADVAMQLRQAIENQPHRLADRLVGLDLDAIRAALRQDGQQMLGELSRGFAKRLQGGPGSLAGLGGTGPTSVGTAP